MLFHSSITSPPPTSSFSSLCPSMESTSRPREIENPSPSNSPNSNGSSISHGNGTPPHTPKPISRSESNPYPTTFVQADSTSFKQVVQMLTGSSETAKQASNPKPAPPSDPPSSSLKSSSIPPIRTAQKKQSFKLYERRNSLKNGLIINPSSMHNFANHHNNSGLEILSPSILDFPSLVLSPVTPSREDLFNKALGNSSEEDKAIAEKGFYLHPSPMSTPRGGAEPQLLPLFPVSSARVSGSSS